MIPAFFIERIDDTKHGYGWKVAFVLLRTDLRCLLSFLLAECVLP